MRLHHLRHGLSTRLWMIEPRRLALLARQMASAAPDASESDLASELRAAVAARADTPRAAVQSAVAIVPVHGIITHRNDFWTWLFGGTSLEVLLQLVRQYRDDPAIRAIVLDVDSPGGTVDGVQEAFDELLSVRGQKPLVAVANCLSASAAYYLSVAADEVVVSPTAEVGSIGVYTLYANEARFWEELGIDIEVIRAGARKIEANPWEPLTDDGRAELQQGVDDYYDMFVKAVAKGRNRPVSEVRGDTFGRGILFRAKEAVRRGLADRVSTLDAVVAKLAGGGRRGGTAAAAATPEATTLLHGHEAVVAAAPAPPPAAASPVSEQAALEVEAQGVRDEVPAARLALDRFIAVEEAS